MSDVSKEIDQRTIVLEHPEGKELSVYINGELTTSVQGRIEVTTYRTSAGKLMMERIWQWTKDIAGWHLSGRPGSRYDS